MFRVLGYLRDVKVGKIIEIKGNFLL